MAPPSASPRGTLLGSVLKPPSTPGGAGHTSRGVVLGRPNGAAIRPPCVLPPLGPALASRTREFETGPQPPSLPASCSRNSTSSLSSSGGIVSPKFCGITLAG